MSRAQRELAGVPVVETAGVLTALSTPGLTGC